ncbi:MAG: thioredoxin domain-containing protein [Candidatus Peribacteraceae bacterium]|jgi:protein-disulfide isomerase
MKKFLIATFLSLLLAACVDTTGLSAESSKQPKGNPNATVTLTEYSDFECPACRAAHVLILKPLQQKYADTVKFEFRQFPLMTIHQLALPLAEASECAADQGKFWEFVDMAYERQLEMDQEGRSVAQGDITTWSQDLNLDQDLFTRCTASRIKKDGVMAEFEQGRQLEVGGTPTFFVNGVQIPLETLDVAAVEKAITDALAKDEGRRL